MRASTDLPRFAVPWPPEVNPHGALLEEVVAGWVARPGLIGGAAERRRFRSMGVDRCAALTFARADPPEIALCGAWLAWIFMLDDRHGRLGLVSPQTWRATSERIRAVVEGEVIDRPEPGDEMVTATADLWRATRAHPRVSPEFARRLGGHVGTLLDGFDREVQARPDAPRSVPDYVRDRRMNAGMYLFAHLLEVAEKIEVPAALHRTPLFGELLDAVTDISAWQNDLISLRAEEARGELSNIVPVLRRAGDLSRREAVEEARRLIRVRIAEFESAERELPSLMARLEIPTGDRPALAALVAQLRQWVNGFLAWSYETPRYADPAVFSPAYSPVEAG